jgi:hypothetical protein
VIDIRRTRKEDFSAVLERSHVAVVPKAYNTLVRVADDSSIVFTGLIDDEPVCIYGLIPPTLLSNRAYLWLLTTELADRQKFLFIRHSQVVIEEILKEYDHIVGDAKIDDARAMKWLKWLGAEFSYPRDGISSFHITREARKKWQTQ